MGISEDRNQKSEISAYSVELCGGTHVKRTGDIGLFRITKESAVAAGVRRIEAVTGKGALAWARQREQLLQQAADALKTAPEELPVRLSALRDERKKLEQEIAELRKKAALGGGGSPQSQERPEMINGVQFIGKNLGELPPSELKPLMDTFKQKISSGIVVLVASSEGKASIIVGVSPDLTARYNAVDLVRMGSEVLGGKGGGGRPDLAQAGGNAPEKAEEAIAAIRKWIA